MKWTCLLLFAVAAMASPEFKIVTFNCEFLIYERVHIKYGYDFNLKDPAEVQTWAEPAFRRQKFNDALARLAHVITGFEADLLVLTEVGDQEQVSLLVSALKDKGLDYPYHAVSVRDDGDRPPEYRSGQHVAILSKIPINHVDTRIAGMEAYDIEIDDPEQEGWARINKGIQASVQWQGQTLHLFGVHLVSERGGFDSDNLRIAQASIVRRTYLPYLRTGAHVIVAGDLNDGRGQPALRRIRGRDDIEGDLIQTGRVDYVDKGSFDERWTYEFMGIRKQIDHILVSPSLARWADVTTEFIPINIGVRAAPDAMRDSDHRAMAVTLKKRGSQP